MKSLQINNDKHTHDSNIILEHVLDRDVQRDVTLCPRCGKGAVERHFDECLGGSINPVHSLDCPHCNYHECSQEFCHTCEAESYISANHMSDVFQTIGNADLLLDYLVGQLAFNQNVKPVELTSLKLMLVSNDDVNQLFNDIFVPRDTRTFHYIKRKLLDAKFSRNLELKITQAIMSCE